jgi:hypothetical protein
MQNWLAHRRGGVFIDALTALQVEKHRSRSPEEIMHRVAAIGARAARGRERIPGFVRSMRMTADQPACDITELWTFGYLIDIILTRNPWMHRIDVSRAVGRLMVLTAQA